MTFQEYLNQTDPKRKPNVELTMEDLYNVYPIYRRNESIYLIELLIHGKIYDYRLENETGVLWTMDNDGNSKSRSCFVIKDFKEPIRRISDNET